MFYKGRECIGSARITGLGPSLQSLGCGEQHDLLVADCHCDSTVCLKDTSDVSHGHGEDHERIKVHCMSTRGLTE